MKNKFAIIAGYVQGETYGLLGPQMAATLIRRNTSYECAVIAVAREDDSAMIKKALYGYFGQARPVIGFSLLGGRDDLVALARTLHKEGATTILAGPQAGVDYLGEVGWQNHGHRFPGYADAFSFALQGPAEQIFPFLKNPDTPDWQLRPGFVRRTDRGEDVCNPPGAWNENRLVQIDWRTLYRVSDGALIPLAIDSGQVLQQIGCPHAAALKTVDIDYPEALGGARRSPVSLRSAGCSFCDVAVDKGFFGTLSEEAVQQQIAALPRDARSRKIPFELINENPLPGLDKLLHRIRRGSIALSRIHLTLRADWLVRGEAPLRKALKTVGTMDALIILGSMGFESFDERILRNLNKGVTVETNVKAVRLIRQLKHDFPGQWGYLREEGGNHGFIHPTPWDSAAVAERLNGIMRRYRLPADILPRNSTPLIIHHASALGDWIRAIEAKEDIRFQRHGSIIAWWQIGDRFLL